MRRAARARARTCWFSVSATTRAAASGRGRRRRLPVPDPRRVRARCGTPAASSSAFEVYGQLKGTPRAPVEEHLAAGDDVLLEVDVQGALAVREADPRGAAGVPAAAVAGGRSASACSSATGRRRRAAGPAARRGRGRGGARGPLRRRRGQRRRGSRPSARSLLSWRVAGRRDQGPEPTAVSRSTRRDLPTTREHPPMAERRASLMEPRIENLLDRVELQVHAGDAGRQAGPRDQRLLQPAR